MKKVFAALCLGLALASTAFATEVTTITYKTAKTEYQYPRFTMENKDVANKINKTLTNEFKRALKYHQESHDLIGGGLKYEVEIDNDKYLSVMMQSHDYFGGAHGMYYTRYFVFNKADGKRLEYSDFVPSINTEQFQHGVKTRILPVYNAAGDKTKAPFLTENTLVTDNFKLNEDESVSLVYDPYELDSYAAGNTYVHLTKKNIARLKACF